MVTTREILLFGAGGHAKVVRDIIGRVGRLHVAATIDKNNENAFTQYGINAGIVAIGDNWVRSMVVARILRQLPQFQFISAIHPAAVIAEDVQIGLGTVVMAGVCINSGARIGAHCIANTGATLDHDSVLDDYASVAPGVSVGGNVAIESFVAIGVGASVIHGVRIGSHAVIGAGAVVVRDIPGNSVAYGVPCRVVRMRQRGAPYL